MAAWRAALFITFVAACTENKPWVNPGALQGTGGGSAGGSGGAGGDVGGGGGSEPPADAGAPDAGPARHNSQRPMRRL